MWSNYMIQLVLWWVWLCKPVGLAVQLWQGWVCNLQTERRVPLEPFQGVQLVERCVQCVWWVWRGRFWWAPIKWWGAIGRLEVLFLWASDCLLWFYIDWFGQFVINHYSLEIYSPVWQTHNGDDFSDHWCGEYCQRDTSQDISSYSSFHSNLT